MFNIKWAHKEIQPEESLSRIHTWVLKGKPFPEWEIWLAFDTYSILAEIFTWESYTSLIKQYYTLPEIFGNNQKLDIWARKYSQTVSTNLCPYFEWWGWILTEETKKICATLPAFNQDPLKRFASKCLVF